MNNGRSFDVSDIAVLENAAELALTAFCWWRADVPQEVCETYWRDVHGIMFARAPGLWQCRQLRLGANRSNLCPPVQEISFKAAHAAQPRGMGHALFLSEADLASFGSNPLPKEVIPNDARNFISRIGASLSPRFGGRTLIDHINEPATQGIPPVPTYVLCFVPRARAAPATEFHHHVTEHIARPWSMHPGVRRLRVEPLPPYGDSAMSSPSVPYQWPSDETYLGWIELAVREEDVVGELLEGMTTHKHAEMIGSIHTYPVREIYTMVFAGRPTEVGLRGYPAVQTIAAAGADSQHDQAVLNLIFGDVVRGMDQPGKRSRR